jgi:hypothetical protein
VGFEFLDVHDSSVEHLHERGLAAAIAPHQAKALARFDGQFHIVQ